MKVGASPDAAASAGRGKAAAAQSRPCTSTNGPLLDARVLSGLIRGSRVIKSDHHANLRSPFCSPTAQCGNGYPGFRASPPIMTHWATES